LETLLTIILFYSVWTIPGVSRSTASCALLATSACRLPRCSGLASTLSESHRPAADRRSERKFLWENGMGRKKNK